MPEAKKTETLVIVKKRKANAAPASKEADINTTSANKDSTNIDPIIKILYHGSCLKISSRGVGNIEYEIGIDDSIDESYVRIAGNASSGAYSTKWVKLSW